jgi:hypothetical protein
MPAQVTTAPAPCQIPPADVIFDAVFQRSPFFRIELPYDEFIEFDDATHHHAVDLWLDGTLPDRLCSERFVELRGAE